MTVDPAAIRVVLEDSPDGKGKGADPKRFYDNSIIQAVNRDYASKLFSGGISRAGGQLAKLSSDWGLESVHLSFSRLENDWIPPRRNRRSDLF